MCAFEQSRRLNRRKAGSGEHRAESPKSAAEVSEVSAQPTEVQGS